RTLSSPPWRPSWPGDRHPQPAEQGHQHRALDGTPSTIRFCRGSAPSRTQPESFGPSGRQRGVGGEMKPARRKKKATPKKKVERRKVQRRKRVAKTRAKTRKGAAKVRGRVRSRKTSAAARSRAKERPSRVASTRAAAAAANLAGAPAPMDVGA